MLKKTDKPSKAEEVAQALRGLVVCPACRGEGTVVSRRVLKEVCFSSEDKKVFKCQNCWGNGWLKKRHKRIVFGVEHA